MKIQYNRGDFDGACAFLAENEPLYGGDPSKVSARLLESMQQFRGESVLWVASGGYYLIRKDLYMDLDADSEVFVNILVFPGMGETITTVELPLD